MLGYDPQQVKHPAPLLSIRGKSRVVYFEAACKRLVKILQNHQAPTALENARPTRAADRQST